ncbi:MAG TPA: menaquinone biosynthesis protein [Thermodesulfovibrionales bacterium]|nr:menaquinone biosynthesis protein [Thermodesulfovibrionales bacterium]
MKIGKINYANLFPIFYALSRIPDCAEYEFIEGVPSEVNRLLREGEIEISPSSSIEYLRRESLYSLIEGHSISSFGPIGSILLFSKRPVETLDGLTILTSSQSETSVALLDIILRKFYDFHCALLPTSAPLAKAMASHSACLLIGDDALREALKWPKLYIYDLGDIWFKNTGLPFVFALWIARSSFCKSEPLLCERFKDNLDVAKKQALRSLKEIGGKSSLAAVLSEDEIVSYWEGISYDLGDEHRKGLTLFRQYSVELGLI